MMGGDLPSKEKPTLRFHLQQQLLCLNHLKLSSIISPRNLEIAIEVDSKEEFPAFLNLCSQFHFENCKKLGLIYGFRASGCDI